MPGGQRYCQAGQNGGQHNEVALFRGHLLQKAPAPKEQRHHGQYQDIHDVRPQDVAQRQFRLVNADCREVVRQFGQGGCQGHQDAANKKSSPAGQGRQGIAVLGQLHSQEYNRDRAGQKYGYRDYEADLVGNERHGSP